MAEWMVNKGGVELLTIKTKQDNEEEEDGEEEDDDDDDEEENDDDKGEIPVLLAAARGHKQMTSYLFSKTPWSFFLENSDHYSAMLLTRCISAEIFDVAAAILQHRGVSRYLPLTHKFDYKRPIYALAHMPSAFRSGTKLGWWRRFIYNILRIQTYIDPKGNIIKILSHVEPEPDEESDTNTLAGKIWRQVSTSMPVTNLGRLFGQFQHVFRTLILLKLPGVEKIYEKKLNHYLVHEILKCFCKRISRSGESELRKSSAYDAILQAAKYGIIEFVDSMRYANPDLLWAMDKNKRGIFSHAILNRQEKVFELIHEIKGMKEIIASREDVFGNNMLHLAAELGPSSDLGLRYNAALQMQRELQWFKAVKRIVPPKCKEARNADGKKPRELFTKNHEELVKAAEKWAKDTASSFTLVGTLIITIMFAAAFTVPGGNNQETGVPVFLNNDVFTVFIIADALSLITSSSSVLMFIGILTSRYAERDFRNRLPLKLLFGLMTLFLSVASMMCAFCAALSMMLKGYRRLIIAAMSLAIIPVLVFIPSLFRISFEIFHSTVMSNSLSSKEKGSLFKMKFRKLRVMDISRRQGIMSRFLVKCTQKQGIM